MAACEVLENASSPEIIKKHHFPPILALVIGVGKYKNCPEENWLQGPKTDAGYITNFLKTRLSAPEVEITKLINEDATRKNIIDGLKELATTKRFKKDEAAIVIYYAGHGAQVKPPEGWHTTQKIIEMICPYDMNPLDTSQLGEHTDPESQVPGIPDITIAALLKAIAREKGDNITLILDCCFSAGLNRKERQDKSFTRRIRQLFNPPPITYQCDLDIIHNGLRHGTSTSSNVNYKFDEYSSDTHVTLAACGPSEKAQESRRPSEEAEDVAQPSGIFTWFLLEILYDDDNDLQGMTYRELMYKFKTKDFQSQNPMCEGKNIDRLIFTTETLGHTIFTGVTRDPNGEADPGKQEILLHAGTSHGIIPGAIINIYEPSVSPSKEAFLGQLKVVQAGSVLSTLTYLDDKGDGDWPPSFFNAKHSNGVFQLLQVYAEPEARCWLLDLLQKRDTRPEEIGIILVEQVDQAKMKLLKDGITSTVFLERVNDSIIRGIGNRIARNVPMSETEISVRMLTSAAHFEAHRKNNNSDDRIQNVRIELYELKKSPYKVSSYQLEAEPLMPSSGNLVGDDGTVTIVADGQSTIGATICNDSNQDLYPYLFYYDPTRLEIAELYSCQIGPIGSFQYSPLRAGHKLDIGHSTSNGTPLRFELHGNESQDVGFLKLIITTEPGDFRAISLPSPFDSEVRRSGLDLRTPKFLRDITSGLQEWSTVTVTLIQTK